MFKLTSIALITAVVSTAAFAGDAYQALDIDNSGSISEVEATALPALSEQWIMLDTDANGELSVEEFAKFETTDTNESAMPASSAPVKNY